MNKIAVCITGEMRYWEITKHIFKDWDVDFFISTWDTTNRGEDNYPYKFHGNTNINEDILETLKPKDYEFLGREYENKNDFHMAKYYYLIYRCNLLKTKYEMDNNFKYDCVLITRPDIYHDKNLIQNITSHELNELVIYSSEIGFQEHYFGLGSLDAAAYGTSSTIDILSSIYNHVYLSGDYNMLPIGHSLIPHYLKYTGLYMGIHMGNKDVEQRLINKIRRPEQYKELMEKHNV